MVVGYMYPKINKPIPQKTRELTWQKYFNGNIGQCYACGCKIDKRNWHCAHVIAIEQGGSNNINNLRVTCAHCNLACGKQNLYLFIKNKKLNGPGKHNINNYLRYK